MQPSATSVCDDSIPWDFSNVDHETAYCDFPESDSVSVQEGTHYDVLHGHRASREPGFNTMRQNMSTSRVDSDARRKVSVKRAWGAFLPLAMDIIQCNAAQTPSRPPEDGFQSYIPSGPLPTSTSTSTPSPPRKSPRIDKRTHGSAPSRNRQTADQVEDVQVKLSLRRVRRERLNDLVCPVVGCHYEQLNGRMPDFRRHIRTHIRKEAEIRCKGVPWQDFVRNGHLFPKISVDEQPYVVPEEDGLWIGGCLKTFSRADALKRHCRNTSCAALDRNKPH